MNVLIIEDDMVFAHMVGVFLASERDQVITHTWASSLREGLAHLEASHFDVILLDLMLGDSRELDTVRAVRAATALIPIVVLTGVNSRELGAEAIRLGAHDYLVKGGDVEGTIRALRNAIERHRIQRELLGAQEALRSAEAMLIQSEKMESVGRLASGVAHEVKNPLAVIQMGVDALRRMPGNLGELPCGVLQDMADAVARAREIVNSLLNFSQPAQVGRSGRVDLALLMEEALRMVAHEARLKSIVIERDIDSDVPPLVVDRNAVMRVFTHLFLNAIQAMPEAGTLRLGLHAHRIEQVDDGAGRRTTDPFRVGQQVVIARVCDTGPGIPAEALPKIFTPFFTMKAQGGGTGLGLYVCRNIINLHGGRITVENAPGGGAVATLTFVT